MRRRPFILSERARASYRDIGDCTRDAFGRDQAVAYPNEILTRCQALADGDLLHQSRHAVFAPDLRDDLRFVRARQHFVISIEDGHPW